ncbi:MAG: hypothetical protein ACE5KO_03995 [Candidatus Bathyarchaeia archaeon]
MLLITVTKLNEKDLDAADKIFDQLRTGKKAIPEGLSFIGLYNVQPTILTAQDEEYNRAAVFEVQNEDAARKLSKMFRDSGLETKTLLCRTYP